MNRSELDGLIMNGSQLLHEGEVKNPAGKSQKWRFDAAPTWCEPRATCQTALAEADKDADATK